MATENLLKDELPHKYLLYIFAWFLKVLIGMFLEDLCASMCVCVCVHVTYTPRSSHVSAGFSSLDFLVIC